MRDNKEFLRGHRAESTIIEWGYCNLTKEEIDNVLKPFVPKEFSDVKSEIYVSSRRQ